MARTATAGKRNGSELTEKEVQAHVGRIREDIAQLADNVSNAGGALVNGAKATANAKADQARQLSQDTIKELQAQLSDIERRVSKQVQDRPLAALGVAAGVGFLLAMLARR
jgi:ElaB/YqjD/DUF883 family membrane-anchored ribosome-binding protein